MAYIYVNDDDEEEEFEQEGFLDSIGAATMAAVGLEDEEEFEDEEFEYEELEGEEEFDEPIPGEVIVVGDSELEDFEGVDHAFWKRKSKKSRRSRKKARPTIRSRVKRAVKRPRSTRLSSRVRMPKLKRPKLSALSALRSVSKVSKPKRKASSLKMKALGFIVLVIVVTIVWFLLKQVPVVGPIVEKVNDKVSSKIKTDGFMRR